MEQPITDYAVFLEEAKQAVTEISRMRDQEETLGQRLKQSQRELEMEEKAVADKISQTIKKRTEELNASYDQELNKGQERLKRARSKREKAKNQGVKERIGEETAELREENRGLRLQVKTLFQQNRVQRYCNTRWYYALFMPHWISDYMRLILMVLVCFLAIPYGVYLLIPKRMPLHLVGIYLFCILLFGGCYVLIGNRTKVRHMKALKEGRMVRDQIYSNNKKIRVITHTIKKDRNEAIYDLQKHDDEIARIDQELAEIAAKKKNALNTFENVTRNIIADEITDSCKDKIAYLKSMLETEEGELKELTAALKTRNLNVADKYEPYLGKSFLQPLKLEELKIGIEAGTSTNLTEAIEEYNKNHA